MTNRNFKIFAAPLQGYTESLWRCAHSRYAGGVDAYFTPFLRVEKGQLRNRDLREISPEKNIGIQIIPQAIFSDTHELKLIVDAIRAAGYTRVDLNLGCPFPPQWKHGRGAGLIRRTDAMTSVVDFIKENADLSFSVKMRLGVEYPDEYRALMTLLNDTPLEFITVHPRVARQQYSGDLFMDEFTDICDKSALPIIFNGDLKTIEDIDLVCERFPGIAGVMIGRGLLARPSLAAQWRSRQTMTQEQLTKLIMKIHNEIFAGYSASLCGDSQILSKIKPYWDYAQDVIDRKVWKAIHKANTLSRYEEAISQLHV